MKIKDVTPEQMYDICNKFGDYCDDKCPFYRLEKNRKHLCLYLTKEWDYKKMSKKEKEYLETEIKL